MKTLLTFSLLIAFLSLSSSSLLEDFQLTRSSFPSTQAEKLIRELNLFPKKDVNVADGSTSAEEPRLVEKPLRFPGLIGKESPEGISVDDLSHHAGYYKIQHSHASRMFYFFFESRSSKEDPVVIWLTGGPGCSSELAMFYENGPFTIADNMSLSWNEYGWDKASNLLYVDQPIGTGFSYSTDRRDVRHDEAGVSDDLYDFLQAFFVEHPEFAENNFFITGESYAGHYIPAFAARIHQGNKAKEGLHINLKGFAIGNGLTEPAIQYKAYTDYALDMGIISKAEYKRINVVVPLCETAIKLCGTDGTVSCLTSYLVCSTIFSSIMAHAGDINYYDIRKKCQGSLCYDFSNMEKFLNEESVRGALGVGDIEFVSCSPTVYQAMLVDWMRNLEVGIPQLLEDGISLLVYAGEYDLICNWLGNSRWVHAMEWSGQKEFVASPEVQFEVDGSEAGLLKSHGALSFLKVHDAGHMVPMDQPKAALEMLKRWTQGKLSDMSGQERPLNSVRVTTRAPKASLFPCISKLKRSPKASSEEIPGELMEDSKFVPLNADDPVYGPAALLLLGFEVEEAGKILQLLKEMGGDFMEIIYCTEEMLSRSLWEAMNTRQTNLEKVKIAKSLPRICFLSGLSGEEMMLFIDAFPEAGLEPAIFAALVPNSADKPLEELIEEIKGDHEMLTAKGSNSQ